MTSGFKPPADGLTSEQGEAVDSIVNLPDDTIPKAIGGKLEESSTTEDATTNEFMFSETLNTPVTALKLSDSYDLSSGGRAVVTQNIQDEDFFRVRINDISKLENPQVIIPRTSTGTFVFQPIDADELTDPVDVPITVPALGPLLGLGKVEDGQTVLIADLKLTSESVKTNITITIKVNGVVFATSFYPTISLFEAPDIYRFEYSPPWDVKVGDLLEVSTASTDGPMIFLGRADTQQKWSRGVINLWDNKLETFEDGTLSTKDRYLRLNDDYITASGIPVGMVAPYEATSTTDTAIDFLDSTATAGGTGATCKTTGSGTFAQGDIVLITDSRLNGGLYEVEDHTANTLEIRGDDGASTIEGWSLVDFIHDSTGDLATITKVEISIIRSDTSGDWETGKGSVTPISFSPVGLGYTLATWGANLQTVGRHPAINGQDNATEIVSLGIQASSQVPDNGTIDTITYYNTTGDNTTEFQIVKNGVVAYTFTCDGFYGMEANIGVPVAAFDNIAIRYTAGTKPAAGLYSMYIS